MTNADIAAVFGRVADLLEFQGENAFRVRAYRAAARTIAAHGESLATVRSDSSRLLTDLDGIGRDLAAKIEALLDTGRLGLLDELQKQVPAVALELMKVPGLGPRKARMLVEELGIESLDDLEAACRERRVEGIKGFGAKTQATILENVRFAKNPENTRLLWHDADGIVQSVVAWMRRCPAVRKVEAAGSWRRGRETVGDIDLVVASSDSEAVMGHLCAWEHTSNVLQRGDTKASIRGPRDVQIDLRVVEDESYGAALQYFTGSKEHNVRLRARARERGLTINEYGVYRLQGTGTKAASAGLGERLAGETEERVYAAVGLPWIPPELREGGGEIAMAEQGGLPDLVTVEDMKGDLHMHTDATDGKDALGEMVRAASERGLAYVAITDHGPRVTMAHGLDRRRLLKQWSDIDRLNDSLLSGGDPPIVVLKGIEVDILEKGGLDMPDEVLAKADWVVASLHYGQSQSRDRITARIIQAIRNPFVSVIGHPTGRLLNRRPAYQVDMDAVIEAAADAGTFLEINANPWRLDLDDVHAAAAKRAGVKLVISTDAHSTGGLDVMRCGVLQARRAGLEAPDVANTRTWAALRKLMKK